MPAINPDTLCMCKFLVNYNQMDSISYLDKKFIINNLIQTQIIKINFNCNRKVVDKIISSNSKSISKQYISVYFDLSHVEILFNEKKIKDIVYELFQIDNYYDNIDIIVNYNEIVHALVDKLKEMIIITIKGMSHTSFLKIYPYFEFKKNAKINASYDSEKYIYNLTDKLISHGYCPNVVSSLATHKCKVDTSISDIDIGNMNTIKQYFSDKTIGYDYQYDNYGLLFLEYVNNFTSINEDIKTNMLTINDLFKIFIQIAYTLECFKILSISHNDLHGKNILIKKLDKPISLTYIVSNDDVTRIIRINTQFLVLLFDYDKSFVSQHKTKIDLRDTIISRPTERNSFGGTINESFGIDLISKLSDEKTLDKLDFYYFAKNVEYILERNKSASYAKYNSIIKKIVYNDENAQSDGVSPYEHRYTEYEINAVKKCMSQLSFLNEFNTISSYKGNDNGIEIWNNFIEYKFNKDDKIFCLPNFYDYKLSKLLNTNVEWQNMEIHDRITYVPGYNNSTRKTSEFLNNILKTYIKDFDAIVNNKYVRKTCLPIPLYPSNNDSFDKKLNDIMNSIDKL